jgi:SAM-dependent methyltransferase
MGLDLYAKVENLFGFTKERYKLYSIFLEKLENIGKNKVLDIGCGSGEFMKLAKKKGFEILGIDLSSKMVEIANNRGLECKKVDICNIDKKYDVAVAIFDVLNYIPPKDVKNFLECVANVLKKDGFFICDINTLYGFEEIAQGALWIDREEEFVAIDSEFVNSVLTTNIVYFNKEKGCYKKESDTIIQYYHDINDLKVRGLKLVDIDFVSLFCDEVDKAVVTFKKE